MSSGRGGIKKKQHTKTKQHENEGDEVEKLLRATEDEILLKLSVDSHMSRASSSHIIHPDLDRRFKALRSNSKPASSSKSNSKPPSSTAKPTGDTSDAKLNKASVVNDDGDDLFARFAALKSTLPSYSKTNEQVEINDEGDEVDEVIRWAIDAAALDPSPPSDDDDDVSYNSSDEQTDDDDDEDEDDMKTKKKKGEQK